MEIRVKARRNFFIMLLIYVVVKIIMTLHFVKEKEHITQPESSNILAFY